MISRRLAHRRRGLLGAVVPATSQSPSCGITGITVTVYKIGTLPNGRVTTSSE
jgi:hypothetical protein